MQERVVAVDIGGTSMELAAVTAQGRILDRIALPSPAHRGGDAFVEIIAGAVADRWPDAAAVGVGTAGTVDPGTGTILSASDTFDHWAGYPFGTRLADQIGRPVNVNNDINAFLLGETRFGVAQEHRDCLAMMLGTGVGGALLIEGSVVVGPHGAAGEIGHMPGFGDRPCTCGAMGHLETVAGGRAIAHQYALSTGLPGTAVSARTVGQAAEGGDRRAQEIFREAGSAVGLAAVMTATMLDLDTVVLGGGVLGGWPWLSLGIEETLSRYPLISGARLDVRRSDLGSNSVLLGAAAAAIAVVDDDHSLVADLDTSQAT